MSPDAAFKGDGTVVTPRDHFNFSRNYAYVILALLVITTGAVAYEVVDLAAIDTELIRNKVIEPKYRLITERVILELIAATFIQVGAGAYFVLQSLFKSSQITGASGSSLDTPR